MPGTTNFLQFNPTQSNQQTDSVYAADALRSGGVQLNNQLPSVMLNKMWYQMSTFVAAFCQMLVGKNYSPMDTSVSALAALLANVLTNADTQPSLSVVTFSPTANFNRAAGQNFQMTVTGNWAGSVVGATAGQEMTFILVSDSTPGHTFTWPGNVVNGGDMVGIPMAANTTYIQKFITRSDSFIYAVGPLMQNP
jgi:hypothetical protein